MSRTSSSNVFYQYEMMMNVTRMYVNEEPETVVRRVARQLFSAVCTYTLHAQFSQQLLVNRMDMLSEPRSRVVTSFEPWWSLAWACRYNLATRTWKI